jgi:hypothetical protein
MITRRDMRGICLWVHDGVGEGVERTTVVAFKQKELLRSDPPPLFTMRGKVSHWLGTIYSMHIVTGLKLGFDFIIGFTLFP